MFKGKIKVRKLYEKVLINAPKIGTKDPGSNKEKLIKT